MKLALLGYGKMGKIIESIALERGHEIVLRKGSSDAFDGLELADVAIDFSVPEAAVSHLEKALELGVPVVCGTTGWLTEYERVAEAFQQKQGALLYGSNFSLGVNLFFELNRKLAELMKPYPQYALRMEEIHHTQKLDAPSGTAISLAQDIIALTDYTAWSLKNEGAGIIPIEALRIDQVPGTHSIHYESEIDSIEIKHTAHNRQGFALGAVIAAEWLQGKTGLFSMRDVLGL